MQDIVPDESAQVARIMDETKTQEPSGEQEQSEPSAPDFQKELESATTRHAELQQQMNEAERAAGERIAKLEGALTQVFDRPQPVAEPEPSVMVPTEDDFLQNPRKASAQMSDAVVQQRLQESEGKQAALMNQLVEAKHRAEIKAMNGHKYYDQVKGDMELYFDQNPNQRVQPGAAENAYSYFVGRKLMNDELDMRENSRGQTSLSESSAVPNPATTPTEAPKGPEFDSDDEAKMAKMFGMDVKEWNVYKGADLNTTGADIERMLKNDK